MTEQLDGELLHLLERELLQSSLSQPASSTVKTPSNKFLKKRASGGRRAKLNYDKQVQALELELQSKMALALQLESQKKALTENLQMLELHCKATGHYVQLMQEVEQQAKADAWLQKHSTTQSRSTDLDQAQFSDQLQGVGGVDDMLEGMDWHQLLDGLSDEPGEGQADLSVQLGGNNLEGGAAHAATSGASLHVKQQQQQQRLSLHDVPTSDRPNEAWLVAMRKATVDDFANVIREFVAVAGSLVLQAEAHGGLTPALNQLCLHVTKYMEFSNVLAIAKSRTLYEAIELDLETRTPTKPPHGFWANVANAMRSSPEQIQQVQAAMRSYTISLSDISEERVQLSKELSAPIQASEAAARAVGQGSRGAVEQAAAANELQQLLAKRLSSNIQRQVLCHSMLRVYHTRKVFTPVQIAKAIICSWPFVANIPSIWAAILESSMALPHLPPSETLHHHHQQLTSPTEQAVPFPSSSAAGGPQGFPLVDWSARPATSCPVSSSGPEHTGTHENSIHGGQRLAGLALGQGDSSSPIHQPAQQQQQRQSPPKYQHHQLQQPQYQQLQHQTQQQQQEGMQIRHQQQQQLLGVACGGNNQEEQQRHGSLRGVTILELQQPQQQQQQHNLHNPQQLPLAGPSSMQGIGLQQPSKQQQQQQQHQVTLSCSGSVHGSAHGGQHFLKAGDASAECSAHGAQRFFEAAPSALMPGSHGGSAHGGQQFLSASGSAGAQQCFLGNASTGIDVGGSRHGGSSHGGGQQFFTPTAIAAAAMAQSTKPGSLHGSAHGSQQFFFTPSTQHVWPGQSQNNSTHGGQQFFSTSSAQLTQAGPSCLVGGSQTSHQLPGAPDNGIAHRGQQLYSMPANLPAATSQAATGFLGPVV